ncbi:MAG TPA: TolC family protein, partial [Bacteroidia bacterium]|nr:TolC family protein [Bacteroidia bacterium]
MFKKTTVLFLTVFAFTFSFAQTRSLDFFINAGLQNSPLLKDYAQQVKSNAVDSSILNATRKPQVNALGMVMMAPSYKNWGYDEAVTNGGNYQAVASVSQSLFNKKIYAPQYEALRIESASATNSGKISEHELKKDITTQYLSAYSSLNQLIYNRSLLQLLEQEETVLEAYVKQGIYRQTDYLALELEKQMQQVQISQLVIQYKADIGQLNILCGIEDTAYYEVAVPSFASSPKPVSYISPFQMQFRIDSLRILNSRSMIDMRYRPRFGWFADAGLLSSQPLTMYRNFGFSVGFLFTVPIYDGKQ